MGIVQKDAFRTTIISYLGLTIGFVSRIFLFQVFLTNEQVGLVNLLVSVGTLFGSLSALGTVHSVTKFFPVLRGQQKNNDFLGLVLLITVSGLLIFSLLAWVFDASIVSYYGANAQGFVHYYYWIIPIGIANVLFLIFDSFLRSLFNNVVASIANELVLRIVVLTLLIMFAVGLITFEGFLIFHCLAYFIPAIVSGFYLFRKHKVRIRFTRIKMPSRLRRMIVTFGFFSYLNTIGGMIVAALDGMMIASILNLKETGIYTTILFAMGGLQVPYRSLLKIGTPLVAKYWKEKNLSAMGEIYKKVSTVNLMLGLLIVLVLQVCRVQIASFLPNDFSQAYTVFSFLSVGWIVDMFMGLNSIIFIMSKKYRYDILMSVAMILIVVGMNNWLIPRMGIVGAAIATSCAYIVYNVFRFLFLLIVYKLHPFEKKQAGLLFLFGICLAAGYFLDFNLGNRYLTVFCKASLYGCLFVFVVYWNKWIPEINRSVNKYSSRFFGVIIRK